jgi:hypothetical protein
MNDRCPSCRATVRAGDPWCTLCWTDLRPKPAPLPPPPAPAPSVPVAAYAAAVPAPAPVDPLTAPLHAVVGGVPASFAAETAPAEPAVTATWPCVECGEANALDLASCRVCTAPFGGRVARLPDPKEARRKVLIVSLSAVAAFLVLLAGFTLASTKTPSGGGDSTPTEFHIDDVPQ